MTVSANLLRAISDASAAAEAAGLIYIDVSDTTVLKRGLRRRRFGRGFAYLDAQGNRVKDERVLARLRSLAVPPAWTDVWYCAAALGHLQATGFDARGRKQYRYHTKWREVRDHAKFAHLVPFANALPKLRRRIARDMAKTTLDRDKVIAAMVLILDRHALRVGNDEYNRDNGSFGLTTLRRRHVRRAGHELQLNYRGKSNQARSVTVTDPRIVSVIEQCMALNGRRLFTYIDELGAQRELHARDVNDYLKAATGGVFTAKEFRTWTATVMATRALIEAPVVNSARHGARCVNAAVDRVASALGNTRAVCRRSYVYPRVVEMYLAGSLSDAVKACASNPTKGLHADECLLLALLSRVTGRWHPELHAHQLPARAA